MRGGCQADPSKALADPLRARQQGLSFENLSSEQDHGPQWRHGPTMHRALLTIANLLVRLNFPSKTLNTVLYAAFCGRCNLCMNKDQLDCYQSLDKEPVLSHIC